MSGFHILLLFLFILFIAYFFFADEIVALSSALLGSSLIREIFGGISCGPILPPGTAFNTEGTRMIVDCNNMMHEWKKYDPVYSAAALITSVKAAVIGKIGKTIRAKYPNAERIILLTKNQNICDKTPGKYINSSHFKHFVSIENLQYQKHLNAETQKFVAHIIRVRNYPIGSHIRLTPKNTAHIKKEAGKATDADLKVIRAKQKAEDDWNLQVQTYRQNRINTELSNYLVELRNTAETFDKTSRIEIHVATDDVISPNLPNKHYLDSRDDVLGILLTAGHAAHIGLNITPASSCFVSNDFLNTKDTDEMHLCPPFKHVIYEKGQTPYTQDVNITNAVNSMIASNIINAADPIPFTTIVDNLRNNNKVIGYALDTASADPQYSMEQAVFNADYPVTSVSDNAPRTCMYLSTTYTEPAYVRLPIPITAQTPFGQRPDKPEIALQKYWASMITPKPTPTTNPRPRLKVVKASAKMSLTGPASSSSSSSSSASSSSSSSSTTGGSQSVNTNTIDSVTNSILMSMRN
jgi:hypothetical protein